MKHIVVIGGGTGSFTVLSGLKRTNHTITAIVAMSDDGGSTGRLRTELGVLPPGDVRQCLVALSEEEKLMLDLMNYRFRDGVFAGHSFGNLLLSALEKVTGDFREAVRAASAILKIRGTVVPVTTDHVKLIAVLENGERVEGETVIDDVPPAGAEDAVVDHIELHPTARANPDALEAIGRADMIVIGPGDFWGSVMANVCVGGVAEAVRASRAKKVFVLNLMTRWGQRSFTADDYVRKLSAFVTPDAVVVNSGALNPELVRLYARDREYPIENTLSATPAMSVVTADVVSEQMPGLDDADQVKRSLIRHDPHKLAETLVQLL